jgi:hypothetical protein
VTDVISAYVLTAIVLGSYAASLVVRSRRARRNGEGGNREHHA